MGEATQGVVVCREPPAAAAGGRILEQGGNAFDAAVATAFAQAVVNPMACGVGGTAEVNLFEAASGDYLIVKAFGGAGSLSRPDTFEVIGDTPRPGRWRVKDNANYLGYQATTIPTFVRVMGEMHRLFGCLPWSRVVEPAVELATHGFEVWPELAASWDPHARGALDWPSGMQTLTETPECERIYLHGGAFLKSGDWLRQEEYGQTLARIAQHGAAEFYEGEIGRIIAEDFAAHDGLITHQDLLRCRATLSRPLSTTYRGYTLHGSGPYRMQMFNILEGFDLTTLQHNSPRYLDTLARCFQAAHVDRARYMGDPAFVDVPTQRLISKERAAGIRSRIQADQDVENVEPGAVPVFSTTGAVVMDAQGNTVSLKHSNGNSSGVVTQGLGFLYNNHMHNFNPRPGLRNSIAPKKEPHGAAGGPLIVSYRGHPALALAHYSRAGTTSEIQIVLNMLEFGMAVENAVSADRIHAEYAQRTVFVDPDFSPDLITHLEALDTQRVVVGKILPAVAAVHRDSHSGALQGGSDPRGAYGVAVVT